MKDYLEISFKKNVKIKTIVIKSLHTQDTVTIIFT